MAADTQVDPMDPYDELRQRVLAQQGGQSADPSVPADQSASPAPATPSPDFNASAYESPAEPTPSAPASGPAPAGGAPESPSAAGVGDPGNAYNAIAGFYSKWTGDHNGNGVPAAEIQAWANSGLGLPEIENRIANSPEAQKWAASRATKATPATEPAPAGTGAAPVSTGGGGGAFGLQNGFAGPPRGSAFQDQIRQIIMSRLAADQGPIDPNSPEIEAALTAARDEGTRSATSERDQLAERLYAQRGGGLNTDALSRQIQQSGEKNAASVGGLKATILMSQYNQRKQELTQLLTLATQTGDAELAREVQLTLGNLQAALQREGLGVNLAEFGAQLDQNAVLQGANA